MSKTFLKVVPNFILKLACQVWSCIRPYLSYRTISYSTSFSRMQLCWSWKSIYIIEWLAQFFWRFSMWCWNRVLNSPFAHIVKVWIIMKQLNGLNKKCSKKKTFLKHPKEKWQKIIEPFMLWRFGRINENVFILLPGVAEIIATSMHVDDTK